MNDWLGVAVQAQPASTMTVMPPLPPLDKKASAHTAPSVESVMM